MGSARGVGYAPMGARVAILGEIAFSTPARLAAWRATELEDGGTVDALLDACVDAGGSALTNVSRLTLTLPIDSAEHARWLARIEAAWSLPGTRSATLDVADLGARSVRTFRAKMGKKKHVWLDADAPRAEHLCALLDQTLAATPKPTRVAATARIEPGPIAPRPEGSPARLAVVDAIVLKARKKKSWRAQAVPAAALARLELAPGKPLSPCLARWLAFDGAWGGLLADPARPSFVAMRPSEIAAEHLALPPELAAKFAEVVDAALPAPCFYVGDGSSGPYFLYAGEPDADGEYPVFYVDADEAPVVFIAFPGFDFYLADMLGGPERAAEREALQRTHERASLGTRTQLEPWG